MFFTESEVKAELSSKTPANTSMCNNHVTLCLYYSGEYYSRGGLRMIIPGGEAPALGCDPSLQTEASIPIIKSDLPGRHVEWISLCAAEPSVTVIRLQSASTLRGRWKGEKKGESRKKRERYSLHVSLQRAPRREVGGISGLSPQLIHQLKKRTKD